jgi:branched-chain amino acid transport system substrate-binding protein
MSTRNLRVIGFLFVALAVLLALVGRPGAAFGEDKFVTWFLSGNCTGPGASATCPFVQGVMDYMEELNSRGGVDGVKIKTITVDDRYDMARGISAYQRYRKAPRLVAVSQYGTGIAKALEPLAARDRLPLFTAGGGVFQAHLGWVFTVAPPYQDGFGAALEWMVGDWRKKGNSGAPVVGFMGWNNPAGKEPLNGGKEYAEKLGVRLLPPEFYPPGSLKHDTWLTRIAKQKANYLYVDGVDPAQTNVIRDAHALGLTDEIQMVSSFWGPLATVGVKYHPEELEGTILVTPMLRGEDRLEHPMARIFTKYQKKPVQEMNAFYLIGISNALSFEQALGIALKEVGYEKISGETMYQALQTLQGMDVSKGIIGRCDYSPTSRRGSREVRFYKITDGEFVPISDWVMTPDCVSLAKY